MRNKPTASYRSGPKKGLPKKCECGGIMEYAFQFGSVFSCCDTCTPKVKVSYRPVEKINVVFVKETATHDN